MSSENRNASLLDEQGREILDPTPVSIAVRYPSQRDAIRDMIRAELSAFAEEQGYESFEEADDFDVDGDIDPSSPYEEFFDPITGESNFEREITDPHTPAPSTGVAPPLEGGAGEAPPPPGGGTVAQ